MEEKLYPFFFSLSGSELQGNLRFLTPRRSNKTNAQFSAQHTVNYSTITVSQFNSWFIQNYHRPKKIHYKSVPEPIKESFVIFLQQDMDWDGQLSTYSSQSLSTSIILLFQPLSLRIQFFLIFFIQSFLTSLSKIRVGKGESGLNLVDLHSILPQIG